MPEQTLVLLLALFVGACAGFAAVLLVKLIDLIKAFAESASASMPSLGSLSLPALGMLLSLLFVSFIIRDDIGHGVTKVLKAVSRNEARIRPHNMYSSIVASSLTIGLGGSVGAEAPIVYTGAAIGSNMAKLFRLQYRDMTVLVGCGAAGAVAAIFKAPLAGVLFTMEVLLFNLSMNSVLPLLLSTLSATMVAYLFLGMSLPFQCKLTEFTMGNVPYYIILGIIGGFGSLYFMKTTLWLEDRIARVGNRWVRWLVCAVGVGVFIFAFPQLRGEGYSSLTPLLNGGDIDLGFLNSEVTLQSSPWTVPLFFLLIFLAKVFAMTLTNAGGGAGGTFGPTLFSGAILGFVVARSLNIMFASRGLALPEQNFVMVGMAALMAGVMQAPLTSIFLIAEMTGGYDLFIPLILTSAVSYGTTRIFERYSIYTKRLAKSGDLLTHDTDQAITTLMSMSDLVKDKYPKVPYTASLGEFVDAISSSNAAIAIAVDSELRCQGIVEMSNVRDILLQEEKYSELKVYNIMQRVPAFVQEDEPIVSILDKFDKTGAWRLPVVNSAGIYLGCISRSRILVAYRNELKSISQE